MKFSSAVTIAALAGGALAMGSEGAKPMDNNMARENGMPATDSKYDSKGMLDLMMKAGAGEPTEGHEKRQLDILTKLLGVINKRMEMTDMEKRQQGGLGGLMKRQGKPDGIGGAGTGGGISGDNLSGGAGNVGKDSAAGAGGGIINGQPSGGAGTIHFGHHRDDEDWKVKRNTASRPMTGATHGDS
ncbi:hypothetical protein JDV02_001969 [Purpureocillium takamizusanense]|uniref:Uncharacterized protein n=1 Tax=Purpureocillium takamizusanense TaxID=2060973 RepID=A0A9Q8Q9B9_9HYPO|nr:uncharacterized protein JDV02_001969 [Purpureocillium takamizusanense]UNI15435.1 hypothetical protein JDV02_001969 [Purpureocillium takamizusanense]